MKNYPSAKVMAMCIVITILILLLGSYYGKAQNTYLQVHETQRSINRNTPSRIAGTHSNIDTCCIKPIPTLAALNIAYYGNTKDTVLKIFFFNGKSCWTRVWTGNTYVFVKP